MTNEPPEGGKLLEWQPIETAPKDGTRLILLRGKGVVCGYWNDDKYIQKSQPYWSHDQERIWGVRDAKTNQPTHWMPLPAPPSAAS